MNAGAFEFDEYAGSARGLFARPVMPGNIIALREHIQAIKYEVFLDGGSLGTPVDLVVADVMLTALAEWRLDKIGYSFVFEAPGTLWPLAAKRYRVVVTFTQTSLAGGKNFILVWQVNTKDPTQ